MRLRCVRAGHPLHATLAERETGNRVAHGRDREHALRRSQIDQLLRARRAEETAHPAGVESQHGRFQNGRFAHVADVLVAELRTLVADEEQQVRSVLHLAVAAERAGEHVDLGSAHEHGACIGEGAESGARRVERVERRGVDRPCRRTLFASCDGRQPRATPGPFLSKNSIMCVIHPLCATCAQRAT